MRSSHVLLVGRPVLLGWLVSGMLEGEPNIEVVTNLEQPISRTIDSEGPVDVLILGLVNTGLPEEGLQFLAKHPSAMVLGITATEGKGFLYELRPQTSPIGELSRSLLVATVTGAQSWVERTRVGSGGGG